MLDLFFHFKIEYAGHDPRKALVLVIKTSAIYHYSKEFRADITA